MSFTIDYVPHTQPASPPLDLIGGVPETTSGPLPVHSLNPWNPSMPRKIRELISDLVRAGFVDRGGKGSHRNFEHPHGRRVTVSGQPGDDAKPYQEREVRRAIEEAQP
jgi:predicted RNA binding protein YcfA (HicA-like mRNA interferase family)